MRHRSINLLSESVRAHAQARLRQARHLLFTGIAVVVLTLLSVHSRLLAHNSGRRLAIAEQRAAHALNLERRAVELDAMLVEARAFVERYHKVALPLRMTDVLASVCNRLPESVSLEQLHMDAGRNKPVRTPRQGTAVVPDEVPPRILRGELSGFAASDANVAEVVDRLTALAPLESVTLDFSRTRQLRGLAVREFRLSFRINLEASYEIVATGAAPEEAP
jgi:hypothetical protein